MIFRATACLFCLGTATLFAQQDATEKPPLPPGPWPAVVGAAAHWVTESKFATPFDPKAAASDPEYRNDHPPRIVRSEVKKHGSAIHEQTKDEMSRLGETWTQGKLQVNRAAGGESLERLTEGSETFRRYSKTPFPDLGWIKPAFYTGVRTISGRQCAVFESEKRVAWLDFETRLPVGATLGDEVREYKFFPPPAAPLTPSSAFAAEFAQWQREAERLIVRPPRP